jgi:hypothetical protein
MAFTDLKLQNEDYAIDDHYDVDSLPQTWNGVLEVRGATSAVVAQYGLEEVNLNEPRLSLSGFNSELVACDDSAKNRLNTAV